PIGGSQWNRSGGNLEKFIDNLNGCPGFRRVIEKAGHQPIRNITSAAITKGRDSRAATPAQARNFLDAMRGVFRWALEAKHVTVDPTMGVRNPKRKKGPGFVPWTEADVAAYEKRWPIGTKERVWLDVLCFLGPRRGDACMIGRQHVRRTTDGGALQSRTQKRQQEVGA